jgi:hypothetical protein
MLVGIIVIDNSKIERSVQVTKSDMRGSLRQTTLPST